jgi:hypothetical protein
VSPYPVTRGRLDSGYGPATNRRLGSDPHSLRRSAEEMLREMAYVLHVSRSVKDSMVEGRASRKRTSPARPISDKEGGQ